MSYFIRILCESPEPIPFSQLVAFIREGCYLNVPRFEVSPDGGQLLIEYREGRRPIIFERNIQDKLIEEETAELADQLPPTDGAAIDRIKRHLANTKQVIAIDVNRDNLDGDVWEMLDSLEAYIARQRNGIVYAPGDGYFDAQLQPIVRL